MDIKKLKTLQTLKISIVMIALIISFFDDFVMLASILFYVGYILLNVKCLATITTQDIDTKHDIWLKRKEIESSFKITFVILIISGMTLVYKAFTPDIFAIISAVIYVGTVIYSLFSNSKVNDNIDKYDKEYREYVSTYCQFCGNKFNTYIVELKSKVAEPLKPENDEEVTATEKVTCDTDCYECTTCGYRLCISRLTMPRVFYSVYYGCDDNVQATLKFENTKFQKYKNFEPLQTDYRVEMYLQEFRSQKRPLEQINKKTDTTDTE